MSDGTDGAYPDKYPDPGAVPEVPVVSYDTARRVVIAAGGTGGHFFPAEALAAQLLARGHRIALLTDRRSNAQQSAVFRNHPVHVVDGGGLAGKGAAEALKAGLGLAVGSLRARSMLRGLHPSAIVGFGGYPTVAPVMGGRMLRHRVPVVLHEQNAVLGRTNRALARSATVLALSFAKTERVPEGARIVVTGNPVRPPIAALAGAAYRPPGEGDINLLVLGGSLGARVLSDVVPRALSLLPDFARARLRVTQQCREEDLEAVRAAYAEAGIAAVLAPFFAEVAPLYAAAHLVIARAGASTVSELAVVGRPAVLVPLASAIDGHQAANAAALGEGARVMAQEQFSPVALNSLLAQLFNQQNVLERMVLALRPVGRADAAAQLADVVDGVLEKKP